VLLIVLFSVMGYCVKIDMYKLDVNNGYKRKVKTVINEGYSTATNLHNVVYDTNHPVLDSTNNFKNITASYNLKGGAQYSYRFWIIVHDPSPNQASKTILVRGDPKSYPVFHVDPSGGNLRRIWDAVIVRPFDFGTPIKNRRSDNGRFFQ
jgi:hypothetical protein